MRIAPSEAAARGRERQLRERVPHGQPGVPWENEKGGNQISTYVMVGLIVMFDMFISPLLTPPLFAFPNSTRPRRGPA